MIKTFTCISCPMGCSLKAEQNEDSIIITGNSCKNGEIYGIQEMTDPRRVLTTCIKVIDGDKKVLPCKSRKALPKELIKEAIKVINKNEVKAPIKMGDILIYDILGTGIDIIATGNTNKK